MQSVRRPNAMTTFYHDSKVCPICKTEKALDYYSQRKDGRYEVRCKDCIRAADRERNALRRTRKTPILPKSNKPEHKTCNTCWKEKPYSKFAKDPGQKDGYRGRCRQCYADQASS